jgi:hypothetical protein
VICRCQNDMAGRSIRVAVTRLPGVRGQDQHDGPRPSSIVTENHSHGLDSRTFSRIELFTVAHQCLSAATQVILMVSKASPSDPFAWWARAAQARRVAGMLPSRDAQLAEAYALECEGYARETSVSGVRLEHSAFSSVGPRYPKKVLFSGSPKATSARANLKDAPACTERPTDRS